MADRLDYGFRCERRAASQLRARRSGGSGRRQRRRRRRLRFHPRRGAAKEAQGQEAGGPGRDEAGAEREFQARYDDHQNEKEQMFVRLGMSQYYGSEV